MYNMADGQATSSKQGFRMECSVAINIAAKPEKIWALLTNAEDFPRWNSTITSIEGQIDKNEKIKLKSTSDPKRTFNLTVSEFEPPTKMVWSDGNFMMKGVRTYTLTEQSDGTTNFAMDEVFSGLILPMIAKSLPDFKPFFEKFVADLKKESEKNTP